MKASDASDEESAKRKAERAAECRRLGKTVRALREERGLSQQELADALGVHRVTIYRFEAGHHDLAMSHLRGLVDLLGSTPQDVLLLMSGHVALSERGK